MATRSLIAYEHPDGGIYAVYCHCHGCIDWTGIVLYTLYNQVGKVKWLILHGGMRNIFTSNIPSIIVPDRPITGVPEYYAKDKETYLSEDPSLHMDIYGLLHHADVVRAEYVYLYKDNDWLVAKPNNKDASFRFLERALQDELGTEFATRCQNFHNAAPYWLQMESPLWD